MAQKRKCGYTAAKVSETLFLKDPDREGRDLAIAIGKLIDELKGRTSKITMDRTYIVSVTKRRFKVILHPDLADGGYWVECPELLGCSSQGDSIEDALDMIKDAIKGHLEVQEELRKEAGPKRKVA